ncbi:MAG: ATP-binding protein [Pseudomonadota bacterium]
MSGYPDLHRQLADWSFRLDESMCLVSIAPDPVAVFGQPVSALAGLPLEEVGCFLRAADGSFPIQSAFRGYRSGDPSESNPTLPRSFVGQPFCVRLNGQERLFAISGVPIQNGAGAFQGLEGYAFELAPGYAAVAGLAELSAEDVLAKGSPHPDVQQSDADPNEIYRSDIRPGYARLPRETSAPSQTIRPEFREPLETIARLSDVMRAEAFGELGERYVSYCDHIIEASQHLSGIIGRYYSELSAELPPGPSSQDAEVVRLVDRAVVLVKLKASARGVTITPFRAPKRLALDAEPDRVLQILVNLLSNAIKFTRNGGMIGVDCFWHPAALAAGGAAEQLSLDLNAVEEIERPERDQLTLTVWDTGIGISAVDQERIFGRFDRGDDQEEKSPITEEDTAAMGYGLGLHISRRLAREMGGDLRVSSQKGRGSRFALVLPLKTDVDLDS